MSKKTATFTHKGWFWFCPIYLAPADKDCPVEARWACLEWLFSAGELLECARIWVSMNIWPDYEPEFIFRNVTLLDEPIVRERES